LHLIDTIHSLFEGIEKDIPLERKEAEGADKKRSAEESVREVCRGL